MEGWLGQKAIRVRAPEEGLLEANGQRATGISSI